MPNIGGQLCAQAGGPTLQIDANVRHGCCKGPRERRARFGGNRLSSLWSLLVVAFMAANAPVLTRCSRILLSQAGSVDLGNSALNPNFAVPSGETLCSPGCGAQWDHLGAASLRGACTAMVLTPTPPHLHGVPFSENAVGAVLVPL